MADSLTPTMSASAAVSIGNYKGVMLCNRPFNGVSSTLTKETRNLSNNNGGSSFKAAFLAGTPGDPVGMNVPIHTEPPHAVKRDKKNTALSKHKKWLHDLQKERARLQEALLEDEENKQERHDRFSQREAKMREAVRNNPADPSDGAVADKKSSAFKRPMWALTKETADEKLESMEDAEADDLINFANNLDLDAFMDDVEIKARVAQVEQQMAQLQSIVDSEEAEEKRAEREFARLGDDKVVPLNANDLARLNRLQGENDDDDDTRTIVSTVLSECKSIRSVHSMRSVAALTKRAEAKLIDGAGSSTPPNPRIVTIDEEQGARMLIKTLPSNLPYIHRNPAI
ncbi:hypothetical protein Poli38472_003330 [Pythium oligandrum]|uniref:Uncharacterized protein n=1 Tax=Pythium oligandrum TaxID=41045 RepID=A0A8K1FBL3_PYTOL|nr:hypothetical protein Poli38472_003330 [Pythium oligandrum]|eukprot:TMW57405.1 hypothetical protein Poli38472_003330 [Pythium oligandrum]